MGLIILRSIFIIVASGIGVYIFTIGSSGRNPQGYTLWTFYSVLLTACATVALDIALPKKRIQWISSIYFGIVIGLFLTVILGYALTPYFNYYNDSQFQSNVMLVSGMVLCYLCTSFLVQTKDDFRFIIPYVEFRRSVKGIRPLVLDTSILIDGRIADIIETNIIDSPMEVPRFVVEDLQNFADSSDRNKRQRGRRGMDILNKLQTSQLVRVQVNVSDLVEFKGQPFDMKLITMAKYLEGKILTNDYSIVKVAKVHDVEVINLNDLARAMKPIYLPGEKITIQISRYGEDKTQGVGYLEDGTMVIVQDGGQFIDKRMTIEVTSIIQTHSGRLVFSKINVPDAKYAETADSKNNTPYTRGRKQDTEHYR